MFRIEGGNRSNLIREDSYKPFPRKKTVVLFDSADLIDCFGFATSPPVEDEWVVTIHEDENFLYRDVFERWINDCSSGIIRQEMAFLPIDKEWKKEGALRTPPLVAVSISTMEICWGNLDTIETFDVTFIVNPLPF